MSNQNEKLKHKIFLNNVRVDDRMFNMVYPPLNAQIGNLGIYGRFPTPLPGNTPYSCGQPVKANLQDYPEVEGGTNISLRLNGYQNFNFYYREDGNGFLSGGGYTVSFLNSSGVNCYPTVIIPYSQNGNNTLGFPVFGGFNFPGTSWGVIGTFLAKIPGGGGATTPLKNATFSLGQNGSFPYKAKTNGNGYVDIYYDSTIPGNFLPYSATNYDWKISGVMSDGITKCIYTRTVPGVVDWQPPSSYLYRTDLGTVTIESQTPGCAP